MLTSESGRRYYEQLTVPAFAPRVRRRKSDSSDMTNKSEKLNSLMKEQVNMIKESQEQLLNIVESIDFLDVEVTLDTVESVEDIVMKSEELIVMVQVITKVRNELGHARLDLEKAKKAKKMIDKGQERVQWLERKLETLLIECHTKSSFLLKSTCDGATKGVSLARTYLSQTLEGTLSPEQCQRMFSDVGAYTRSQEETLEKEKHCEMAVDVIENSQRMIPAVESCTAIQKQSFIGANRDDYLDFQAADGDPSETVNFFVTEARDKEHVSCSSPQSSSEDSSTSCRSSKDSPSLSYRKDSYLELCQTVAESSDDEVDKYWRSDHHKFEWPNASVQQRAPLSWHSLGLPVQDSFISKEKPLFTPDLPWRERSTQVNSVLDIHKIALDKLYARLHQMYDAIEKATEASINPILKNDKIETRMGNIESKPSSSVQEGISKSLDCKDIQQQGSDDRGLSSLGKKKVSFPPTPDNKYVIPVSPHSMVKTPALMYPRHASIWCPSQTPGGCIVKKITANTQVKQNRTQTILSKRLSDAQRYSKDLEKQEEMIWRPSIVYKMIRATKVLKIFQTQIQQWNTTRVVGPKWKRVEWLLGTSGLQSPTRTIVIKALKTLGELRCFEEEVGEAMRDLVNKTQDPRILYEASKALVLSGHWDSNALEVLLNALQFGNNNLKNEILDAFNSVENIPFFDQNTPLFQHLRDCLVELVKDSDCRLSFSSAVCLGKISVINPIAKTYLTEVLNSERFSSKEKGQALDVLVRQMNCKDNVVVRSLLHELSTSVNWKIRVEAADLLIFLGERCVLTQDADEIFAILERLLWDHAHQEVRSKVAELLNTLKLRHKACRLVLRRLEDPEGTVRGRAIISLATLEMKGGKELRALLDILALDSSVYARIQAIRAFSKLHWNDPRVLRSLKEREKGGGILAREAKKALKEITDVG